MVVVPSVPVHLVRLALVRLAVALALLGTTAAVAQPDPSEARASLALVPGADAQVRTGASLYAFHCAACHGDTGQGFEEAVAAFPDSHQTCTKCHRPANPRVMDWSRIRPNNAFSVGEGPALLGPHGAVRRFGSAAALEGYVSATMPRPFPGALSDAEYDAIVAFLTEADANLADDAARLP